MNTLSSSITPGSTEHKDCSDMVEPGKWWIFNSSEEQRSIISAESLAGTEPEPAESDNEITCLF